MVVFLHSGSCVRAGHKKKKDSQKKQNKTRSPEISLRRLLHQPLQPRQSLSTILKPLSLLSKSFTEKSLKPAVREELPRASRRRTAGGRAASLPGGPAVGLPTELEAAVPSPALPATCKKSYIRLCSHSFTWSVRVCVCVFLWFQTGLTQGGGQRLKIKCAQREWPGRC